MIELGIQERSAISALQWLPVEGIRAQYAEYLKDCEGCNRIEILRAIVIYRIQEKFYGQRVSRETERLMEKAVEGDKLLHAPADDVRSSRRKLVRNWKGKDYAVFVVNDSLSNTRARSTSPSRRSPRRSREPTGTVQHSSG